MGFFLNWLSFKTSFYSAGLGFDSAGNLLFVSKTENTPPPRSPGRYIYERSLAGIALVVKSPAQKEPSVDGFVAGEDDYFSELTIVTNRKGIGRVFWVNNKNDGKVIMSRKIENNKFALEPEVVCHSGKYVNDLRASINEKGDIALFYQDAENCGKIVTLFGDSWSEPFLIAAAKERPSQMEISIDEKGNVLAAYNVIIDENRIVKAAYKPVGQPWEAPAQFFHPDGDSENSKIKSDKNDSFVMIWENVTRHRHAIWGAVFSTKTQTWSPAQPLSPKGDHYFGSSFDFWGPGKGYITWTTISTGFDANVQIAELSN